MSGNVSRVERALAELGHDWTDTKNFAGPKKTEGAVAGGRVRRTQKRGSSPSRRASEPGPPFAEFLSTVVLPDYVGGYRRRRPTRYVHDVAQRVGEPETEATCG